MIHHDDRTQARIYDALYRFGLAATSSAFFHLSFAIRLAMEDPSRMTMVTKLLYPKVARIYGSNWKSIERSLARQVRRAWQNNPELLRQMAHYRFFSCPPASHFIAIVAAYLSAEAQTIAPTQNHQGDG